MAGTGIPTYKSDSESSEAEGGSRPPKRPKTAKNWKMEQTFSNKSIALEAVNNEGTWGFHYKNIDSVGNEKYIYRCKKVKSRGEQCKADVSLHFPSDSENVLLYRSQLSHTCNSIETKSKMPISEPVKREINNLFNNDSRIKPKKIVECLIEKGLLLPKKTDINNYLASLRRSKFGTNTLSLGEMEKFLIDNSQTPDSDDKAFIISHEVVYEEPSQFRFFASSKTLLKLAIDVDHIHTDATYKLIWQGFPVLIIGTTDRTRQFHICGLAVCSNEQTEDFIFLFNSLKCGVRKVLEIEISPKILVSDASHSISNAFKLVFGDSSLIIMCWAHMKRAVQHKAESLIKPKKYVREVMNDIDQLQLSKNEATFNKASGLFLKKWKSHTSFVEYFQTQWLRLNRNWFEGAQILVPSTNNSLESFNRVIKDEHTLRERLPLSRFSILLMDYIKLWSTNYTSKIKSFSKKPDVNLQLWIEGYNWAKQQKTIILENETDYTNNHNNSYIIPAGDDTNIEQIDVTKKDNLDFNTFDEFKSVSFKVWRTVFPKDKNKWLDAQCDCPAFFKKMICKHIVGLAIRLKVVNVPPEAKAIPIGQKRRRGRPAKAKKALLIQ